MAVSFVAALTACQPVDPNPIPLEAHIKCAEIGFAYYQYVCSGKTYETGGSTFQGCDEPSFEIEDRPDTGRVPHRAACVLRYAEHYRTTAPPGRLEKVVKIFDVP